MIKISRDAELDFDDDISKSFLDKIAQSVKERSSGDPVRFIYDSDIRLDSLKFLLNKMQIDDETDSIIPGGKYHNRRDYMKFPSLNKINLLYKPIKALNIKGFKFLKFNCKNYICSLKSNVMKLYKFIYILILSACITSCIPNRDLVYLQKEKEKNDFSKND